MAIRFDKKLNQEINRTIKNFNQKVARLERQERELLPSKITKKEITSLSSRKELKNKLKELQSFSKRGAEDVITTSGGARLTRYELENLKHQQAKVKAALTREINQMKVTKPKIFGKEQDVSYAEMGDEEYLNALAKRKYLEEKDIDKLSQEKLENYKKILEKTEQQRLYMNTTFKKNYENMLFDMAYYFNYDATKVKEMKEKIDKLNPNDFLRLFKEDKSIRAILDYYPIVTDTFNPKEKRKVGVNPEDIEQDVKNLYDALYENIEDILRDYA